MSDHVVTSLVSILMAVVGVAIIAVLISKQANTAGVLTAGATGFGNILKAAVSPVTGGGGLGNTLSFPGGIGQ